MVPPCINKYYILDLQPENSFVRYAVEQGHTVFMVSWRNVGARAGHAHAGTTISRSACSKALDVAQEISRQSTRVNALGFCVGGTLLAAALAVLAAQKRAERVASATFLATMLDFEDAGRDRRLFIDENASRRARRRSARAASCRARSSPSPSPALRANDLVWPYVVNNYLMGGTPRGVRPALLERRQHQPAGADVLHYVRNTYLENKLRDAGRADELRRAGRPRQGRRRRPSSSRRARTTSCRGARPTARSALLGGEKKFVLGATRPHRGRRQSGGEQQAQLLGQRDCYPDDAGRLARAGDGRARQLVAALGAVAGRHSRAATRAAPAQTGNARISGDRACARSLREAEGMTPRH